MTTNKDICRREETQAPAKSNAEFVRRYLRLISLIVAVLIIAIFWGFNYRYTRLIKEHLTHEARAFFQEIVQTRQWIIKQGGVYVKKTPGMRIDPFLAGLSGVKSSIRDENGDTYLLRNHAAITKMISAMATEERLFAMNITSLTPLNPLNEPDQFERQALESFAEGRGEVYAFTEMPGGSTFRYMAPLPNETACRKCHDQQAPGDAAIRGGISITLPAEQALREINKTRIYTLIAAISLLTLLLAIINNIARRFIADLHESEQKLIELAATDPLTGLLNRREGIRRFEREISLSKRGNLPLSVIIIDIDLFKQVNDNFGHQAGDAAIKRVADILVATLRRYDIICRYGGEEYLVVLPATGLPRAFATAERIRGIVAKETIATGTGREIKLTISSGVSALQADDSMDSLVYRADNALYIAKEEGRNQVQQLA
jgi:diguanylate cyclase (GGDEF)-like protein